MLSKYFLAIAITPVLIAGLLISQICVFNCAFYGCASSTAAATTTDEHSACHQHQKNSTPQKQSDSHRCAGHFEGVMLPSTVAAARQAQVVSDSLGVVQVSIILNEPAKTLTIQSGHKPDRSPPTYSVLRI